MKNLIKCLTLMLFASFMSISTLNAQVLERGNFIVGGTLGFSGSDSDVEQTVSGDATVQRAVATQLNVAPSIGYFLTDNFALGFGLDYTLNTIDQDEDGKKV